MSDEYAEGEVFGMLTGYITIRGMSPDEAAERAVDEGADKETVDKLLRQHWDKGD